MTYRRKPCEKGALHRQLILSATAPCIIHGVRIALRAGGVSLLPAVALIQTGPQTRMYTSTHTPTHRHTHTHNFTITSLCLLLHRVCLIHIHRVKATYNSM